MGNRSLFFISGCVKDDNAARTGETDTPARFSKTRKVNRLQLGSERWNT